jgi:hypothetical protein
MELRNAISDQEAPHLSKFVTIEGNIGQTPCTVALLEHTGQYAEIMENAMRRCKVIAVEQPGHNNAGRRRDRDTAPLADKKIRSSLDRLTDEERRIAFIDIHQDDPRYPKVAASDAALNAYLRSAVELEPVAKNRELLLQAVDTTAQSYEIRDTVLQEQIPVLAQSVGHDQLGVLLGSIHYRVAIQLGLVKDPAALTHRIRAVLAPFDTLIEAAREHEPLQPKDVDHALLWTYFQIYRMDIDNTQHAALSGQLGQAVLEEIDRIIASDATPGEKHGDIGSYLRAISDILQEEAQPAPPTPEPAPQDYTDPMATQIGKLTAGFVRRDEH